MGLTAVDKLVSESGHLQKRSRTARSHAAPHPLHGKCLLWVLLEAFFSPWNPWLFEAPWDRQTGELRSGPQAGPKSQVDGS